MTRGRTEIHTFASDRLRGNPLGDPSERRIPVYLPPAYDREPSRGFPVVFLLSGFGGRGRMMLADNPWSPAIDDRMDALIDAGRCGDAILVMPDAFTRVGGSQYLDSPATGPYRSHLIEELVPWVDATFRTLRGRDHRGVAGKSSGGFGAMVLGMLHPETFGAVASHSGDVYFEYAYRPDLPKALSVLQEAGGVRRFVERFEKGPQRSKDDFLTLNIVGMSAAYSPDASAEWGIGLPFDLVSGAFREDVWARWLEWDPLGMLAGRAAALRSMRALFVDCGSRDEFQLHHGTRLLVAELARLGIPHRHEEYPDGHMNVSYRYETSLPILVEALAAPPGDD